MRLRRREFITLVGGAVVAWPMVARAQGNTARLGVIGPNRESTQAGFAYSTLLEELSKLGFAEGRSLSTLQQVRLGVRSALL